MRKVVVALIMVLLVVACTTTTPRLTKEGERRCEPLPEAFQEADLIGTWQVARKLGVTTDRITLRENGTYKQIYEKSNGYRYESPWKRWWIEHRPNGGIYLHLEGMRYCNASEECDRPEGGGGDWLFHDYCEDRALRMKGEVVLAVIRMDEPDPLLGTVPRGIVLLHMQEDPDDGLNWFYLQE